MLSDSDFAMFDNDIRQEDYDFYQRHRDAFRRMWVEQVRRLSPVCFMVMAYLHCRTRIQVPTRIRIPNPMATLYYAGHIHIAWTRIWIPIETRIPNHYCTHFCDVYPYPDWDPQDVSDNVNKPLREAVTKECFRYMKFSTNF